MKEGGKAAYLDTEHGQVSDKRAKFFGETVVVASSKEQNYNHIPKGYTVPADADYFTVPSNNTIFWYK
jgi:phosphoserine aminotransferase